MRKGDYILFCHGAKWFLGTTEFDSNCFELNEKQNELLSHKNDFYKSNFGVTLTNVDIWQKPNSIINHISHLSFISDPQQFTIYFQGGI